MKNKIKFTILLVLLLTVGRTFCISVEAKEQDIRFRILLPVDVQIECADIAKKYDLSPTLLMSLVYQESRGILVNATQITNPYWFRHGIDATGVNNPKENRKENIEVCAWYLRGWFEKYDDVYLVLDCWNKGEDAAVSGYNPDKPSTYSKQIEERAEWWEPIWYTLQEYNRNPYFNERLEKEKEPQGH